MQIGAFIRVMPAVKKYIYIRGGCKEVETKQCPLCLIQPEESEFKKQSNSASLSEQVSRTTIIFPAQVWIYVFVRTMRVLKLKDLLSSRWVFVIPKVFQAYYEVPVEKCTSIELNEARNIMTSVPGCTRSETFSAALPATRVSSCMRKPVVSNIVYMHVPRPMRTMPGVHAHWARCVCVNGGCERMRVASVLSAQLTYVRNPQDACMHAG